MLWINILHFYQPPTQEPEILHQVAKQSYLYLVNLLNKNPEFKLTINICGCLCEMLAKNGYEELLNNLKNLAEKGQIEFTGSASYHALLPLLPEEEIIYQINENERINKKYFKNSYAPKGFFLPELAYSEKVAKVIKKLGYEWIVLDEISINRNLTPYRVSGSYSDKVYQIEKIGLNVIFRNRTISNTYVPETVYDLSQRSFNNRLIYHQTPQPPLSGGLREFPPDKGGKGGLMDNEIKLKFSKRAVRFNLLNESKTLDTIITASDSELYGHHYKDNNSFLNKIIEGKKVKFLTATELINSSEKREKINPINSSWESTKKDLKLNCPYHLWLHKNNKIHQYLWKLASLAIEKLYKNQNDEKFYWARYHLNRGIASCTFWWASEHDLREHFGPIAWNPDFVEKGANELIRCIRSISSLDKKTKIKAEKIYLKIKKLVWIRHWKKYS